MKNTYEVELGLGRMANRHRKKILVEAETEDGAYTAARFKYYDWFDVEHKNDPVRGKMLTVVDIEQVYPCKDCGQNMGEERGKGHKHCVKCIAVWHVQNDIDDSVNCADFY